MESTTLGRSARTHERPAAVAGAPVTDGDEHGVARHRQSQWPASHAHSLRHLVRAGIDPHDVAVELVAHPDAACVDGHRSWPVAGGNGCGAEFVSGSILETVPSRLFATHAAPSP